MKRKIIVVAAVIVTAVAATFAVNASSGSQEKAAACDPSVCPESWCDSECCLPCE